ncbi:site-specific integrase [Methylococcus geothermalis]|uniref:site-specific integrase n=1 Tax=Methylococcus geothermalis TaxID=2681310 RepID=UPI001E5740A4|nr:site-specific integrase [Methylococcus geothermalis]
MFPIIREYIRDQHGKVRFERLRQAENHLLRFIEIAGDRPLSEYRSPDVTAFAHELSERRRLSASTVNGHLSSLSALFNWAIAQKRHALAENPCSGCKLPAGAVIAEQRQQAAEKPFTHEQLRAFFEGDETRADFDMPYKYWVPLIQLHTGARIGEICQLEPKDIALLDNRIPAFRFVASTARGKSERRVPVHPKLIDLGLLAYIEGVSGLDTLWPGLIIPRLGSKGQNVGMWLSRHLERHGLKRSGRRTEAFRSTFQHYMRLAGVPELHINAILGHRDRKSAGTARKPLWATQPDALLNSLAKLDYEIEFCSYAGLVPAEH